MHTQLTRGAIRRQAKMLAKSMKGEGFENMTQTKALNAVAKMYGYRDWRTAHGVLPEDSEVPDAVVLEPTSAHLPALEPALLKIVDRRLAEAIRREDGRSLHTLRAPFNKLNSSQGTMKMGALMDNLQQVVAEELQARISAMRAALREVAREHRLVGDRLVLHVMHLVKKHYPEGLYLPLLKQVPEIYQRRVGVLTDSDLRGYDLKMGLITIDILNGRLRALREIETDLQEWRLSTRRDEVADGLIRVVYSTEALHREPGQPGQISQRDFASLEAAMGAPMPEGATFAMIRVDEGVHVYRGGRWEFFEGEVA